MQCSPILSFPLAVAISISCGCSAGGGGLAGQREATASTSMGGSGPPASDSTSSTGGSGGTAPMLNVSSPDAGGLPVGDAGSVPLGALPPGEYVTANSGKYMLGPKVTAAGLTDTGVNAGAGCNVIVGVVRDFRGANEPGGHPDFEVFSGWDVTRGLVGIDLGANGKPVYTSKCETAAVTT